MYTSIITLTGLLTLTTANPIQNRPFQQPYFSVSGFSFSRSDTSSRYEFNISFPRSVVVPEATSPTVVPAFTDSVACTGTYFFSSSETSTITPINACGYIGDGSNQTVNTKLDVVKGDLYMTYTYNGTADGQPQSFVYTATQSGLQPVSPETSEAFNTPAFGPGALRQK